MSNATWIKIGSLEELLKKFESTPIVEFNLDGLKIAVSYQNQKFGAVSGVCNHLGGPLGKGKLSGEYIECPWHYYKFHRITGDGEPGYELDHVPHHNIKVEANEVWVERQAASKRTKISHPAHPLTRELKREPGPIRVVGISTTAMDAEHPRFSTSEMVLDHALKGAALDLGAEVKLIKLNDLKFRNCEGFYSKSSRACSWPCSITEMDAADQMDRVYEAMVHWADVICVATPIRWGSASALYYKMAERLNCIQNQITTHKKYLIQNKVACFVITGGQDNIQAVAGQLLGFYSELGFVLPPFPYVAHSLGWTAENMERNIDYVQKSEALREGAKEMIKRAVGTAQILINSSIDEKENLSLGGRKGHNPLEKAHSE